ncbi:MAG: Eco29kI family restriction endonuclease, partial [Opitutaceae bacterium]|nr:Eco29kI family restriction endonuclease [Opitutaceae bacterium]
PLGESLLIARFSPVWNLLVDGFGNHDPGRGRYNGLVPKWDVLHPGRAWAKRCRPRTETASQITAEVSAWLAQSPALMQSRYVVREAEADYMVRRDDASGQP